MSETDQNVKREQNNGKAPAQNVLNRMQKAFRSGIKTVKTIDAMNKSRGENEINLKISNPITPSATANTDSSMEVTTAGKTGRALLDDLQSVDNKIEEEIASINEVLNELTNSKIEQHFPDQSSIQVRSSESSDAAAFSGKTTSNDENEHGKHGELTSILNSTTKVDDLVDEKIHSQINDGTGNLSNSDSKIRAEDAPAGNLVEPLAPIPTQSETETRSNRYIVDGIIYNRTEDPEAFNTIPSSRNGDIATATGTELGQVQPGGASNPSNLFHSQAPSTAFPTANSNSNSITVDSSKHGLAQKTHISAKPSSK